jgi:hypothetical protein
VFRGRMLRRSLLALGSVLPLEMHVAPFVDVTDPEGNRDERDRGPVAIVDIGPIPDPTGDVPVGVANEEDLGAIVTDDPHAGFDGDQ